MRHAKLSITHKSDIIGNDEDPGLPIESFAMIKLHDVNYKLYKYYFHYASIQWIKKNSDFFIKKNEKISLCFRLNFPDFSGTLFTVVPCPERPSRGFFASLLNLGPTDLDRERLCKYHRNAFSHWILCFLCLKCKNYNI